MPFACAYKIKDLYWKNEASIMVVYGGELGIGKSAYAFKNGAELYGWEKLKEFIVFKPRDFVERCWRAMEQKKRNELLIWDDAGLHLNYMDWYDPFVTAVVQYLNVARTNWGCIMLTTPSPLMVVNKVRTFPDCYMIRIDKIYADNDEDRKEKPRKAVAYKNFMLPDMRKTRVRKVWEDEFTAMMPDDFYAWYLPIRDSYAKEAILKMREKLAKDMNQITESIVLEQKT